MKRGCKKLIVMMMMLLFVQVISSGCNSRHQEKETVDHTKDSDEIEIGISFDTFVVERWQRDRDVFVSKAAELGAKVNVQNANGSTQKQIEQIEYFIEKKVDAIVIVAIDSYELTDVIERAHKENIYIIAYDRLIYNANVDLYVSFDNEEVGTLMAQAIENRIQSGDQILMLCGPTTDPNVAMVEQGFMTEINSSDLVIRDKTYISNWNGDLAADYINSYENLEDVDAIMCGNDNLASQVITVLSEKRKAGSIYVVGQDADLDACQRIVEGTQLMTVFKFVDSLAQTAAEYTVAMVKGNVEPITNVINNGLYDIPYVYLEPTAVTKDNMDKEIVDSGFHSREDVYLNVKE